MSYRTNEGTRGRFKFYTGDIEIEICQKSIYYNLGIEVDERYIKSIPGHKSKDLEVYIQNRKIIFESQVSHNFDRYRDIRIDFVSVYKPYKRFYKLKDFSDAVASKEIQIKKWGKLVECEADVLCVGFYPGSTLSGKSFYKLYSVKKLQDKRSYFKEQYEIQTNKKNEPYGSVFIPVNLHDRILKTAEIRNVKELLQYGN